MFNKRQLGRALSIGTLLGGNGKPDENWEEGRLDLGTGQLGRVRGGGAAHLLHHLLLLHEHLLDLLHLLVQLIQVHLQWTIGHVVSA